MNPITFWARAVLASVWPWSHREPLFTELEGADLGAFMREMYPENYRPSPPAENVITLDLRELPDSD